MWWHSAETRFRLSAKRTSPFKSTGASVQSTTGSRGVRISGSNAGYTMFRGIVKGTGYPLHSPVSPSLPLPCVTVCHHISTGVYISCIAEPLKGWMQTVSTKENSWSRYLNFVLQSLCVKRNKKENLTARSLVDRRHRFGGVCCLPL